MFRRMILKAYLVKLALALAVNGVLFGLGYLFYSYSLLIFSTVVWTYTLVNFIAYMGPLTLGLVRIWRSPTAKMLDAMAKMFKQAGVPIEFANVGGGVALGAGSGLARLDSEVVDGEVADGDNKPTVH